jgi:uncharacterized membrane protein
MSSDAASGSPTATTAASPSHVRRWQKWTTVAILIFVNLINYMDRLTIAGTHLHHSSITFCRFRDGLGQTSVKLCFQSQTTASIGLQVYHSTLKIHA